MSLSLHEDLATFLQMAEGARTATGNSNAKRPGYVAEAFMEQVEMDAGTRNRRYQYNEVAI